MVAAEAAAVVPENEPTPTAYIFTANFIINHWVLTLLAPVA